MTDQTSALTHEVSVWLSQFGTALDRKDWSAAVDLFGEECFWRDLVAFTWNIKTLEGKAEIRAMLAATISDVQPTGWQIAGTATDENGVTEAWLTFETAVARGKGYLRLKSGKCWTLLTTMTELTGFEEQCGASRPLGTQHGVYKNQKTWLEQKSQDEMELGDITQPYCVIIGGGQGGIGLAARLKRLHVPTIIIEKNSRAGDSWRNRYKSLCLHDPVWYDHLPYLPFPDHWPVFSPKDKIGDWLEMYTKVMELNYWHSTVCRGAQYHADTRDWSVTVEREGRPIVLRPRQLVLATGMSGMEDVRCVVEKSDGFSCRRYASAENKFQFPERRNRHVSRVYEAGAKGDRRSWENCTWHRRGGCRWVVARFGGSGCIAWRNKERGAEGVKDCGHSEGTGKNSEAIGAFVFDGRLFDQRS